MMSASDRLPMSPWGDSVLSSFPRNPCTLSRSSSSVLTSPEAGCPFGRGAGRSVSGSIGASPPCHRAVCAMGCSSRYYNNRAKKRGPGAAWTTSTSRDPTPSGGQLLGADSRVFGELQEKFGEGGIRTLGTGLHQYNGL